MTERSSYKIIESSLDKNVNSIDAEIGEKISMPFSNSHKFRTLSY